MQWLAVLYSRSLKLRNTFACSSTESSCSQQDNSDKTKDEAKVRIIFCLHVCLCACRSVFVCACVRACVRAYVRILHVCTLR